jgi:hypothetical protein
MKSEKGSESESENEEMKEEQSEEKEINPEEASLNRKKNTRLEYKTLYSRVQRSDMNEKRIAPKFPRDLDVSY